MLNHILCACPKSLGDGRYQWRHDRVLQEVAKWVDWQRLEANQGKVTTSKEIQFVAEGQPSTTKTRRHLTHGILTGATDWELHVDLKKKLMFPADVAVTRLRPDMLLISRSTNCIYIVELTVPWEDRLETSHQLKSTKYQDLVDEAKVKGWKAVQFPIEVGCRGFVSTTTRYFLRSLGIQSLKLKQAIKAVSAEAESSSRWLWLKKNDQWTVSEK